MKRVIMVCFMLLAGLTLLTGCASTQKTTASTPIQSLDAPDWVVKGSGAF